MLCHKTDDKTTSCPYWSPTIPLAALRCNVPKLDMKMQRKQEMFFNLVLLVYYRAAHVFLGFLKDDIVFFT